MATMQAGVDSNSVKLDETLAVINRLKQENETLKSAGNVELRTRTHALEQYSRINNVITNYIPVTSNENVEELAAKACRIAGT